MVGQQQSLGREELAGAAINDHNGVFDAGAIWIVDVGDWDLESSLL